MHPGDILKSLFSDAHPIQAIEKEIARLDSETVTIAIIGRSGTGKSSLINALYGQKIAKTGSTETTQSRSDYEVNGFKVLDLPGSSTLHFPINSYFDDIQVSDADAFILTVAKRVYEDDLFLLKTVRKKYKKDLHIVRSMIDQEAHAAAYDGTDLSSVLKKIRTDLSEKCISDFDPLVNSKIQKFWLISAHNPTLYDFPSFLETLIDELPTRKREKLIYSTQAYTQKLLDEKKALARKQVLLFAGLSAANGFNPLLGVDLAADIAIITKMNQWILKCFKLNSENLESNFAKSFHSPHFQSIVKKVLSYGAKEFAIMTIKSQAKRLTTKEVAKWIPIMGQFTAAGIGFTSVAWLGNELIDKCCETILELLELET